MHHNITHLLKVYTAAVVIVSLLNACGGGGGGGSSTGDTSTNNQTPVVEAYPDTVTILGSNADEHIGNYKIRVQNLNREFSFFRPANPQLKKLPLVIDFHGASGVVAPGFEWEPWVSLARKENFFLLKPQAVSDSMNAYTYWNVGWNVGRDDAEFVKTLMDLIVKQQDVDLDRIYVTGMSSGGHMAFYTAQALQDRIAAVAPISGSIMTSRFSSYTFHKPMPICNINGDADRIVNIMGGDWYLAWSEILSQWITNNKVNPTPVITHLADTNKIDGSTVMKFEYRGLTNASDIDDYRVLGGGHSVPGIERVANQDFNAYETIWTFFKNHKLSDPY